MGVVREGLEGFSGVYLSGENVSVYWVYIFFRFLSGGGGSICG